MTQDKKTIEKINNFFQEMLSTEDFPMDGAINGIDITNDGEIKKVIGSTSPSLELFEKAKEKNAQLIITHHSLNRKEEHLNVPMKGPFENRVSFLKENNIGLLSYHLPLDFHEEIGNNILILKALGVDSVERIGSFAGVEGPIFVGEFNKEKDRNEVVKDLEEFVNQEAITELYGKEKIKNVAVVTGGGAVREILDQVVDAGIDMYITGEIKEEIPHYAKETKLNYVCGGHYATETCGVKELLKKIEEKFGLETEFIDLPVKY